jgi:predicted RNA-binding protein with PIN domain
MRGIASNMAETAMRWLIDGYNVMHAGGRLGPKLGPKLGREGFRRARRRFLDELAAALPPEEAQETTVVFDASVPPGDFRLVDRYRGLQVSFALGDENADARIERLIAAHSTPKALTVVSSDHRIRQAAHRRKAAVLTAEDYWERIDDLKERQSLQEEPTPKRRKKAAEEHPSDDRALWQEVFGDIDESVETREALSRDTTLLTDEELAELKREIEREP